MNGLREGKEGEGEEWIKRDEARRALRICRQKGRVRESIGRKYERWG